MSRIKVNVVPVGHLLPLVLSKVQYWPWPTSYNSSLVGAWARHNNYTRLDEFAEQQIVDCSKSYGNEGCQGGFLDAGVTYAMDKGLESESSYHYEAENGHW